MQVTVLGRGGGCPRAGEACAGMLVRAGDDTALLLDCGSGVAGRLQQACPLTDVDHVVLSHWHADHCGDAGVLLHGRLIQTLVGAAEKPLRFFAPAQEPDLGRLTWEPYARAAAVDEGDVLRVGPLTCTFTRTQHPVPCLAVHVRDEGDGAVAVYTADGALTEKLAAFCAGADLLVAECSLYAGASGAGPGHLNADDAAELARRAAPGTLVLTHLPLYGNRSELLASVRAGWDGDVRLARELEVLEVAPGRGAAHAGGEGSAR